MGADMLLACIGEPPRREDVKLDWEAGRKAIYKLTTDELESDPELEWRADGDDVEDRRRFLLDQLRALQECLEDKGRRDVSSFKMFGWWIHFTGGMTSGDDPTYAWEPFTIWGVIVDGEKILNAVGLAWPPVEAQPFTIQEQPA